MVGIDHRIESVHSCEKERVQLCASLAGRIHIRQIGPELSNWPACRDTFRWIRIGQYRLEDEVDPSKCCVRFLREDDSVLSAIPSVGGREIESIDERQRNVIAGEGIRLRQRTFGSWTTPRQSIERRAAVDEKSVAVRGLGLR